MDERSERIQQRLEGPLLFFALLTIPAIVIEQSNAGPVWNTAADVLNWSVWLAFLGEIVLMLSVVPDRWRWVRDHPLDLAIVVLTPPFLPAGLEAARLFRLLRLVSLLKAGVLVRRLLSTEGVRDVAVLALLAVLGGGAAFAAVEKGQHLSTWDGVWWAITTVTTVGYGKPEVQTTAGRIIAIVVMLVGIGFVAILTAAAADRFVRSQRGEERRIEDQLDQIIQRLDALDRRQQAASQQQPPANG